MVKLHSLSILIATTLSVMISEIAFFYISGLSPPLIMSLCNIIIVLLHFKNTDNSVLRQPLDFPSKCITINTWLTQNTFNKCHQFLVFPVTTILKTSHETNTITLQMLKKNKIWILGKKLCEITKIRF